MIGSGLGSGLRRSAAGPFEGLKFALGIILVIGLLMVFVIGRLIDSAWLQIALLATYSCVAALWIVLRIRRTLRSIRPQ